MLTFDVQVVLISKKWTLWALRSKSWTVWAGSHFAPLETLRPVYIGDFCRGNSMQFLSRLSCNSKIARVNQVRFSLRFVAATSQGFRTCLKLVATLTRQTLHGVAATKIACVNEPLDLKKPTSIETLDRPLNDWNCFSIFSEAAIYVNIIFWHFNYVSIIICSFKAYLFRTTRVRNELHWMMQSESKLEYVFLQFLFHMILVWYISWICHAKHLLIWSLLLECS